MSWRVYLKIASPLDASAMTATYRSGIELVADPWQGWRQSRRRGQGRGGGGRSRCSPARSSRRNVERSAQEAYRRTGTGPCRLAQRGASSRVNLLSSKVLSAGRDSDDDVAGGSVLRQEKSVLQPP